MKNKKKPILNHAQVFHPLHGVGAPIAYVEIDDIPYCLTRFEETEVCEWVGERQLEVFEENDIDLPFK